MKTRDQETVSLTRDCSATTVPQGERVALSAGGTVQIVQQLGGSTTVKTEMGTLLRIDGADNDALGLDAVERYVNVRGRGPFHIDRVTEALHTVYDPEIPVSIVDLGLVYRCEEVVDDDHRRIEIDMTMTAPGCGMGDVLRGDAMRVVSEIAGVDEVEVNLVWTPPWTLARVPEDVRLELGLM